MDRDEVFGLRDYRKVWKQVILFVNLNLLLRNYAMSVLGLKKCESYKAAGAEPQTPMGEPPCVGWAGGGGGVSLAHPHKTLAEKRAYCRNHDIVSK